MPIPSIRLTLARHWWRTTELFTSVPWFKLQILLAVAHVGQYKKKQQPRTQSLTEMTTPAGKANFPCESCKALILLQCNVVLSLQTGRTSAALPTSSTARTDTLSTSVRVKKKGLPAIKHKKTPSSVLFCCFWNRLISSNQLLKKRSKKGWGKRQWKNLSCLQSKQHGFKDKTFLPSCNETNQRSNSDLIFCRYLLKSRTTSAGILMSLDSSSSHVRQCNVSPPVFCPNSEISGA